MKVILLALFVLSATFSTNAQTIDESKAQKLIQGDPKNLETKEVVGDQGNAVIAAAYKDPQTGLQFINLKQVYKGIRVVNAVSTKVFKEDVLQSSVSTFIQNIETKAPAENIVVTVPEAIAKTALHLGLPAPTNLVLVEDRFALDKKMIFSPAGIAKQNIEAELVWISDNDSTIHLSWSISVDAQGSADYWNVKVDAHTGSIISKSNYTRYDNFNAAPQAGIVKNQTNESAGNKEAIGKNYFQPTPPPTPTVVSATYNVVPFPLESPFTGSIATETDPWKKAGAGNNATTYGWHFDGTYNYNITRGNNVYAYDDSMNIDRPGRYDTSSTTGATLSFNNTPDFTLQPTAKSNRRFATDNLFYWGNIMHDVFYQYGFNELSGNFQRDNMGRVPAGSIGGWSAVAGNDPVNAQVQDGSGMNNANFLTLPDGLAAKMQVNLFTPVSSNILSVSAPASLKGAYGGVESAFSTTNKLIKTGPVNGDLILYKDDKTGTVNQACNAPYNNIAGKIAVIYRGGLCSGFTTKVKNAQYAGAKAVIIVDDGSGVITMGGMMDNTITIPAIMVSAAKGALLIEALNNNQVVTASFDVNLQFDGGLDNGIITHEYTHGISSRLTGGQAGNASCLENNEEGGEGWSDYVALMMTTDWTKAKLTDGTLPRSIGAYAFQQTPDAASGIRTYPYSTSMTIDPHTYANVALSKQFPQTDNLGHIISNATELHYIGEIWCSAIWDMTWNIIQQEGRINPDIYNVAGGGGNVKALQLVIMGMKLQPCSPGFLDARDAILKADSILYGNAHKCAIWTAFAKRGMGFSAEQGSSNSTTDNTAKFDVPAFVTPTIVVSGLPPGGICAGTSIALAASIANGGTSPLYQWTRNGVNITNEAGANSPKFTTGKLKNNDTIQCILTSNAGCAANATAISALTIVPVKPVPVVLVTASGALNFCNGNSVVFTSSSNTLNQWYKDGSPVSGATNTTYTASASGSYAVQAANASGCSAISSPSRVTVTVVPTPVIIQNSDTLISNAAAGNQWFFNSTIIPNAVNQKHKTLQSGSYTVRVTGANDCLSEFSTPIAVVAKTTGNLTFNNKDWSIFPVPVINGVLHIRRNGLATGTAIAQVVTMEGRAIAEKTLDINTQWNIGSLANGHYYLRIVENKTVSVYAFIKQ